MHQVPRQPSFISSPPAPSSAAASRFSSSWTTARPSASPSRAARPTPTCLPRSCELSARWVGQDGSDYTGFGSAVGPDGIQDVHLAISGLHPAIEISSLTIDLTGGPSWQFGLNPKGLGNAELVRQRADPTRGDLYFQPTTDPVGKRLKLTVAYANRQPEVASVVAGRVDPRLRMPAVALPAIAPLSLSTTWLGQGCAT